MKGEEGWKARVPGRGSMAQSMTLAGRDLVGVQSSGIVLVLGASFTVLGPSMLKALASIMTRPPPHTPSVGCPPCERHV